MMLRGATHRAALMKSRLSIRRWKSTNAQAAAEVARKAAAAVLDVAQDVALKVGLKYLQLMLRTRDRMVAETHPTETVPGN